MKQKTTLFLMFFLALMLPILSFIGQQNQENRSMAAGVNSKCVVPSNCGWDNCKGDCSGSSDLVCYGSGTNRTCKIKSGGYCNSSAVCYSNHYCSRTNNHCRKIDPKWIGDYSVEGVSVQSMLGGGSGGATKTPTNKPTVAPTKAPTKAPTRAPTKAPTRVPTKVVTQAPTKAPTKVPTKAPTKAPTKVPTKVVTQAPTKAPTRAPTKTISPTGVSLVKEVILSPTFLQLKIGDSNKITAKTVPVVNGVVFLWQSSDAKVATVDVNGVVVAKNKGETTITVKVEGTSIHSEMKVIVNELVESLINFKFAFSGITPGAECIDKYLVKETKLNLSIGNIPKGIYEENIEARFEETSEVDSAGNRIFKIIPLALEEEKFGMVDSFNYIKVKGPWHLRRRMCLDGQLEKLLESTLCDINFNDNKVYDFSKYTLLTGDVNFDGVVNIVDLGWVKTRLDSGLEIKCGIEGDLNMDGVVNTFDLNLVKKTLTERDDE